MTTEEKPFGLAFYEALKKEGYLSIFTIRMNYAEIRQLKRMDRQQVLKVFRSMPYAVIQHIKQDSPEELASYFAAQAREAERAMAMMFIAFNFP